MSNICKIYVAEKYVKEVTDIINKELTDQSFNDVGDLLEKHSRYPFIKIIPTDRISTNQRIALVTADDEYCYNEVCHVLHKIAISVVDISIIISYNIDNYNNINKLINWINGIYLGNWGVSIHKHKVDKIGIMIKTDLSIYIPEIIYDIEKQY